jgi:hypothetical protein
MNDLMADWRVQDIWLVGLDFTLETKINIIDIKRQ